MHELYELKEQLMDELVQFRNKQKKSMDDVTAIKYLASAIDHICNIVKEAEEMEEDGYSMRGGRYAREGGGNRYSYEQGGNRYSRGGSYARGRRGYSRGYSMGRYSREGGYSRTDGVEELVESVRGMMQELPPNLQQDAQRFVQQLEQEM